MITWGHRKAFIFHDCILQGGSHQKDRKKTSIDMSQPFWQEKDENTAFSLKRFLRDVLIVRETACALRDSSKFLMASNQVYEITLGCW